MKILRRWLLLLLLLYDQDRRLLGLLVRHLLDLQAPLLDQLGHLLLQPIYLHHLQCHRHHHQLLRQCMWSKWITLISPTSMRTHLLRNPHLCASSTPSRLQSSTTATFRLTRRPLPLTITVRTRSPQRAIHSTRPHVALHPHLHRLSHKSRTCRPSNLHHTRIPPPPLHPCPFPRNPLLLRRESTRKRGSREE